MVDFGTEGFGIPEWRKTGHSMGLQLCEISWGGVISDKEQEELYGVFA